MIESVDLVSVWMWVCPSCSHTNYENPPALELEEAEEAAILMGEYEEGGEYAFVPENVLCGKCLALHPVSMYDEDGV